MKKIKLFCIIGICAFVPLYALDLSFGIQLDNFAFLDSGVLSSPKKPGFGCNAEIASKLTDIIGAEFKIQRTPHIGNLLKSRISFSSQSIMFSFGPSIAFLNKEHGKKEFASVFQPGFGVGMHILTDKGFFARFDMDFSLYTGLSKMNIYINNGNFELGMRVPHAFVSVKLEQCTRTSAIDAVTTSSLTDASLNFEVFSKPSQFVFPLSCIARIAKFKSESQPDLDRSFLSIILRLGFSHNIYNDLSYYITGEVPIYDIKLKGDVPTEIRYGIKTGFSIGIH